MWKILQLLFPPKKWMKLISTRLSTASIKYLNQKSPAFRQFQNGCNKLVIEPRVVQVWSEIILVISNHAYDFSPNSTPLSSITIIYQLLSLHCKRWLRFLATLDLNKKLK